jgi:cob(I)alamin adenosyltransferase
MPSREENMADADKGYVQVYTGNGKGKTTAALGLCFRAAGHGHRSLILQFMKGQIDYGELEAVKRFADLITIEQGGRASFVSRERPDPEDIRLARETLARARTAIARDDLELLVLDEINVAVDFGLIPVEEVLALIRDKRPALELVLTGRGARPEVIACADLVTEMREVKHYWKNGVPCRTGIER